VSCREKEAKGDSGLPCEPIKSEQDEAIKASVVSAKLIFGPEWAGQKTSVSIN